MPVCLSSSPTAAAATTAASGAAHRFIYPQRPCLHRAAKNFVLLSFVPCRASSVARGLIRGMADVETQKAASPSLLAGHKQALLSLSDKRDLSLLGNGLQGLGYSIVSTGGTAFALEEAGVSVTKVEEITHFPEMVNFIILLSLTKIVLVLLINI
ncbi:hypothetical protein BHE74_00041502 [Ensete ventricosum]|nr:hypothetical protein BHE74_00041502 [Ensete ventricosum]